MNCRAMSKRHAGYVAHAVYWVRQVPAPVSHGHVVNHAQHDQECRLWMIKSDNPS